MTKYLKILYIPFVVVIVNYLVSRFLLPRDLVGIGGDIFYNVVRVSAIGYAGWLMVRKHDATIRAASLAGAAVFLFDSVILNGGMFLVEPTKGSEDFVSSLMPLFGIAISSVLWSPVALFIGAVGGYIGYRKDSIKRKR
jgi:hypothetical protein